jgi:hypothetical protein
MDPAREPFDPEVESGVADFVRFRDRHLARQIPEPPRPWQDLTAGLARMQQERISHHRARHWFLRPGGLVAVAALAAMTYVIGVRRDTTTAPPPVKTVPSAAPAPASAKAERPASASSTSSEPAPPLPDPRVEVRILSVLHAAGADLGDPVEIRFDRGTWKVAALGLEAARAAQLREALAVLPAVQLVVDGAGPAGVDIGRPAAPPDTIAPPALIFAPQLESYFGSKAELLKAIDGALDHSQAVLAHAYALHDLEQRFPPAVEAALGEPERRLLDNIRLDHNRAVSAERGGVAADFRGLAGALGISTPVPSEVRVPLLDAAVRWDRILGVVLGGAGTGRAPSLLKQDLSDAYADLQRSLEGVR